MSDERRKSARLPLLLEVGWEASSGKHDARTSDVSLGGCFVDSLRQATEGEPVNFKMRLPDGDWIEIQSVVAYVYPNIGFGVRFLEMPEEAFAKLKQLLDEREARS